MATLAEALRSSSRSFGLILRAAALKRGTPVTDSDYPVLHIDVLVRALDAAGVRYIVIGGVAMMSWDHMRATLDLDVCYALDRANCRALLRALRVLRARPEGYSESDLLFARGMATQLETDGGRLDLLAVPSGTTGYDDIVADAGMLDVAEDLSVPIPSRETMLRMKRAANRPGKDWVDIDILEGGDGRNVRHQVDADRLQEGLDQ